MFAGIVVSREELFLDDGEFVAVRVDGVVVFEAVGGRYFGGVVVLVER